ncbi:putative adhesin [Escherichia coli]
MVNGIGHIHHRHDSHQSTRESSEAGRLGSRTVRIGNNKDNVFSHSEYSCLQKTTDNRQKIQERSVKHDTQNNSRIEEQSPLPPPLPPKLRRGVFGWEELSTGSNIEVSKTWLTEETRLNLEKKYDISITPVFVGNKEIGYVFGQNRRDVGKIYLSCHGSGEDVEKFEKPASVNLKFIAKDGHDLLVFSESALTKHVAKNHIAYKNPDKQVYAYDNKEMLKNYHLMGDTEWRYKDSEKCAMDVAALKRERMPINLMVLNPNAEEIHLKDVIQGVNDTFRRMPELILSNCRGEDDKLRLSLPAVSPGRGLGREFMPNSEKRMAGDWTRDIRKLNNPLWRAINRKKL